MWEKWRLQAQEGRNYYQSTMSGLSHVFLLRTYNLRYKPSSFQGNWRTIRHGRQENSSRNEIEPIHNKTVKISSLLLVPANVPLGAKYLG
jgi:hypothetical protein